MKTINDIEIPKEISVERIKVIRLDKLQDLYNDFKSMGYKGEEFIEFILGTKDENERQEDAEYNYCWEEVNEDNLIGMRAD